MLTSLTNMLLIGGATRNVGKTSFTVSVIRRFSAKTPIVALKVKTIYPNDSFFHGKKDKTPLSGNYRITEETTQTGSEDTNRMLQAGANRVFRLKVKAPFIKEAFAVLQGIMGNKERFAWVCESNSLREVVQPGLFLLIAHKDSDKMKPSAKRLQYLADQVVYTNGKTHAFSLEQLVFQNNRWELG